MTPSDQNIADAKRKAAPYSTAKIIAERDRLLAVNAELIAALRDVIAYAEHNNISEYADRQGSIEAIAYRNMLAAIDKAQSCAQS